MIGDLGCDITLGPELVDIPTPVTHPSGGPSTLSYPAAGREPRSALAVAGRTRGRHFEYLAGGGRRTGMTQSEEVTDTLRSGGRRLTGPRRQVIRVLTTQAEPASAESISAVVPDVHASSVYRTLNTLESSGWSAMSIWPRVGAVRVGPPRSIRPPLSCERCGLAIEIPEAAPGCLRRPARDCGFALGGDHFESTGRCVSCAAAPAPCRPVQHRRSA